MKARERVSWETVHSNEDRKTDRLRVPGGWIYLVVEKGDLGIGILYETAVFVPDPKETR